MGETNPGSVEDFPESAIGYMDFLRFELVETYGAEFFQVHHPAPKDMSESHLEIIAGALREVGWRADVAQIESGEETLLGVRVRSHDR